MTIIAPYWLPPHAGHPQCRPAPSVLSQDEAALLLRASPASIPDYIRKGLRHARVRNRRVFLLSDVLAFAEGRAGR